MQQRVFLFVYEMRDTILESGHAQLEIYCMYTMLCGMDLLEYMAIFFVMYVGCVHAFSNLLQRFFSTVFMNRQMASFVYMCLKMFARMERFMLMFVWWMYHQNAETFQARAKGIYRREKTVPVDARLFL